MVLVPLTFVFDPTAPLGSVDALYMNPALIAALSNSGQPPPNTEFAALGSRTGLIAYLTPAQIEALLLPPVAHRIVRPIDPRDPGGGSRLLAGFVWPDGGICLEPSRSAPVSSIIRSVHSGVWSTRSSDRSSCLSQPSACAADVGGLANPQSLHRPPQWRDDSPRRSILQGQRWNGRRFDPGSST